MFKKYKVKKSIIAIKYDGNNINEINLLLEYVSQIYRSKIIRYNATDRGVESIVDNGYTIKINDIITYEDGTKLLTIITSPISTELYLKEGNYLIFDTNNNSLFALPEFLFKETYVEERTETLYL